MKKKEQLKQIFRYFHLNKQFDVKARILQPPLDAKKIITLIGVTRYGKFQHESGLHQECTGKLSHFKNGNISMC